MRAELQCFAVRRGEVAERLNPSFYDKEYQELLERLLLLPSIRKLGSLIQGGSYGVLPPGDSYLESGGIRFLRATELLEGNSIDWDACLRAPQEFERHDRARLKTGDLLIAVKGATIASDKSICTIDELTEPTIINGSIFRLRPISDTTNKFLLEALSTNLLKTQMRKALILNNAVDYLSREIIDNLLIPLPDLDTQRALVAEMESARAARQAKLSQAEELFKGIDEFVLDELGLKLPKENNQQVYGLKFGKMGQARIDPHFHHPDFDKLIRALQTTKAEQLGNVVEFSDEVWNPEKEKSATFRYIEISGVNTQTGEVTSDEILVNEAPSRARMIAKSGDILVSLTRPHRGAIALLDKDSDNCIASTGFAVLRKIRKESVLPEYLWAILRNPISLRQMLQRSSGGNYPAITDAELKQILIPIPKPDIQKKIVAELQTRRAKARALRESAEREWQSAKEKFEKALLGEMNG